MTDLSIEDQDRGSDPSGIRTRDQGPSNPPIPGAISPPLNIPTVPSTQPVSFAPTPPVPHAGTPLAELPTSDVLRVAASVLLALPRYCSSAQDATDLATVLATGLRSVGSADLAGALLARADLIEAVRISCGLHPSNSAVPYYLDVLKLVGEVRQ